MFETKLTTAAAIGLIGTLVTSQAHAQSSQADAEIALLKQQLRLMEQKLDRLQKQTTANTATAASAKADAKVAVANAQAAVPVKGPVAPPEAIVTMPGNRPTICTADNLNCVSLVSRLHFDAGGYNYRPNSAATVPQRLDDGVNVRRAGSGWPVNSLAIGITASSTTSAAPRTGLPAPRAPAERRRIPSRGRGIRR